MTAYIGVLPSRTNANLNGDMAFNHAFGYVRDTNTMPGFADYNDDPVAGRWDYRASGAMETGAYTKTVRELYHDNKTGQGITRATRGWLYDVIHILPIAYTGETQPRVQVGAITKDFIFDVQVWNAMLEPSTVSLVEYSQSGVFLDAVGYTMESNELHTFPLTVYRQGAGTIKCRVTIDTTTGDWWFDLSGTRTYSPPVWALSPVKETLQFKTWTFVSDNGKEQRMDLRDIPRRSVSFQCEVDAIQWLTM